MIAIPGAVLVPSAVAVSVTVPVAVPVAGPVAVTTRAVDEVRFARLRAMSSVALVPCTVAVKSYGAARA